TVGIGRPDPDKGGKLSLARAQALSEKGLYMAILGVDGPLSALRFALKVPHKDGQSWEVDEIEETLTAHGPEEVKVPAGTYQAIRVEHRKKGDPKSEPLRTFWYAPRVGNVKVVKGDFIITMKSFTPAKD